MTRGGKEASIILRRTFKRNRTSCDSEEDYSWSFHVFTSNRQPIELSSCACHANIYMKYIPASLLVNTNNNDR